MYVTHEFPQHFWQTPSHYHVFNTPIFRPGRACLPSTAPSSCCLVDKSSTATRPANRSVASHVPVYYKESTFQEPDMHKAMEFGFMFFFAIKPFILYFPQNLKLFFFRSQHISDLFDIYYFPLNLWKLKLFFLPIATSFRSIWRRLSRATASPTNTAPVPTALPTTKHSSRQSRILHRFASSPVRFHVQDWLLDFTADGFTADRLIRFSCTISDLKKQCCDPIFSSPTLSICFTMSDSEKEEQFWFELTLKLDSMKTSTSR